MGLSRAQKIKKHGDSAAQAPTGRTTAARSRPAARSTGASTTTAAAQRREQLRPEPESSPSSPMMLVGVLMAVAALFLLYVNLVILPGFASAMAGGHGVPELRLLGFDAEWFRSFTDAMDDGAAEAYRSIHRSTALIAPLGMTVGWAAFVLLQSRGAALFRWAGLGVVALFTIVYLLGSSVLDRAVADPQDETLVGMASLLMNLRGALLLGMVALLVWAMLRSVRRIAGEMAQRGRQDQQA